jgi:glycogen synthase
LANYLEKVTTALSYKGHEVSVFVLSEKNEKIYSEQVAIYRIKFNKWLFFILNTLTFKRISHFLRSLISSFQLCQKFQVIDNELNFDVIQSTSYLTPGILLNSRKDRSRLVTRISSIHKIWRRGYGKKNKLDIFLVNHLEIIALKKSYKNYAPSRNLKAILSDTIEIKIDLLEPPLSYQKIEKDSTFYEKYLKGKKYFLFFGSIGALKGVDFLANNIYQILDSNLDYYFVFIGKNMRYNRGHMMDFVNEKAGKHSNRIIFSKTLKHSKLFPIIENAKAVILPSRIDNLPNTLIESMSLGKIVVGTYDGGFDQLIEHQVNGFLLNFGNDHELLNILQKITEMSLKEIAEYEQRARKRVYRQLDFENRTTDLEVYFKNIVQK